jgi:hypothetical protein
MFHVVVQSVMHQLNSRLKLPAPSLNRTSEKILGQKRKDRTGFFLQ